MKRITEFEIGDTFTFQGLYRRRTLWQWLVRRPKELQVYLVTAVATDNAYVAYAPTIQLEDDRTIRL
jgi:hypothetical protein